jgi:hypothetical protein
MGRRSPLRWGRRLPRLRRVGLWTPCVLRQCLGRAGRYGLPQVGTETAAMHRLTQGGHLRRPQPRGKEHRSRCGGSRAGRRPPRRRHRPRPMAQVGPAPAAHPRPRPAATTNRKMMYLACSAVWHLHARGEYATTVPSPVTCMTRGHGGWGELGVLDGFGSWAPAARARTCVCKTQRRLTSPMSVATLSVVRSTWCGSTHTTWRKRTWHVRSASTWARRTQW